MTTPELARDDEWMRYGTDRPCQNDPELWFSNSRKEKNQAIRACAGCPLLQPCRTYALAEQPSHGIWGGLTETERRKYRKGIPACGTRSAYLRHRAKAEQCITCESWRVEQIETDRRVRLADEHLKGGTRTGARIHLRLGEPACRACATAAYRERQSDPASQKPRQRRTSQRLRTDAA
jgi:hypothetical protein